MGNWQSPSGLASSASSPRCGEPFCAGFARVEFSRAMPARKASSLCGEVAEQSEGRKGSCRLPYTRNLKRRAPTHGHTPFLLQILLILFHTQHPGRVQHGQDHDADVGKGYSLSLCFLLSVLSRYSNFCHVHRHRIFCNNAAYHLLCVLY